MSEAEHIVVRQEPDQVPYRWLLLISGAGIVVAAIGVVVSAVLLYESGVIAPARAKVAGAGPRPIPLEQTEFEHAERGVALREQQRKTLMQYGWVNRDAGIAHIPIEQAMDQRAEGAH